PRPLCHQWGRRRRATFPALQDLVRARTFPGPAVTWPPRIPEILRQIVGRGPVAQHGVATGPMIVIITAASAALLSASGATTAATTAPITPTRMATVMMTVAARCDACTTADIGIPAGFGSAGKRVNAVA